MPHLNFPALAALFREPEHVLRPVVPEVAQAELGEKNRVTGEKSCQFF